MHPGDTEEPRGIYREEGRTYKGEDIHSPRRRWQLEEIEELLGAPWELVPGKGVREMKSTVHFEGVGAGVDMIQEPHDQSIKAEKHEIRSARLGEIRVYDRMPRAQANT